MSVDFKKQKQKNYPTNLITQYSFLHSSLPKNTCVIYIPFIICLTHMHCMRAWHVGHDDLSYHQRKFDNTNTNFVIKVTKLYYVFNLQAASTW